MATTNYFDEKYYLQKYPDVAKAITNGTIPDALTHFRNFGKYEGRDPNPMFDTKYYLEKNPDVAEAVKKGGITPFEHFVNFGQYEQRDPSSKFSNKYYLARNSDVANLVQKGSLTGFEHYFNYGQYEGRSPRQLFSQMVVFGDSLSDDGNSAALTGGKIPPTPPYFQGRFSNGPVWVEQLAPRLGLPVNPDTNVAVGGATTGTLNTNTKLLPQGAQPLPGLQQEIDEFLSVNPKLDPNGLYVIWAGANNFLGGGSTDVTGAINDLKNSIDKLTNAGANNIMVNNLPDLGTTPLAQTVTAPERQGLTQLTNGFNNGAKQLITTLEQQAIDNFILVDVNSAFKDIVGNPGKYGFLNVTNSALTSPGGINPNQFAFWDQLHPTTATHGFIADTALKTITGISEAASII
jgi:phospholipase/lecithinase/hemolysin